MRQTTGTRKSPGEKIVKDIKRANQTGRFGPNRLFSEMSNAAVQLSERGRR